MALTPTCPSAMFAIDWPMVRAVPARARAADAALRWVVMAAWQINAAGSPQA